MSKIYAALEHAQAERSARKAAGTVEPLHDTTVVNGRRAQITPARVRDTAGPAVDNEIAALYDPVLSSFPQHRGVVVFTSPNKGAGTSTVARKFALFLAEQADRATLLMDADRLKPSQLSHFKATEVIEGDEMACQGEPVELSRHVIRNSKLKLAGFAKQANQLAVPIAMQRVEPLLTGFREKFDVTVIDCQPPETAPETTALASKADCVVLVLDADRTRAWQARRCTEVIESRGGQIIGLVFNKHRAHMPRWLRGRQ